MFVWYFMKSRYVSLSGDSVRGRTYLELRHTTHLFRIEISNVLR